MLSRRSFLVLPLGLLAGCSLGGVPSLSPSPSPTPAELLAARALIGEIGGVVAGLVAQPGAEPADGLNWLADVLDDYLAAVDSGGQRPSPTPTAPVFSAAPSASLDRLDALARRAATEWAKVADDRSGLVGLLWASMSISAGYWPRVARGKCRTGGPQNLLEPEVLTEAAAKGKVILGARELAYAMATVLPVAKVGTSDHSYLLETWTKWTDYADKLADELRRDGQPVPQPAAVYQVRPVESVAAALALLGELETRMLEPFGRWLAANSEVERRGRIRNRMVEVATSALSHGGPALRWPGWPVH